MNRGFSLTVYGISVAFFGCFLIWPILQILQGGFFVNGEFTLAFFGEVFFPP